MNIPETYKALFLKDYDGKAESFYIAEKPMPTMKEGEVLVKMHYSVINPSDLMFVRGLYGIKKKLPKAGGFEGSGVVVATGSGVSLKLGTRVACVSTREDGTWAEYVTTNENSCDRGGRVYWLSFGATLACSRR